MRDVIIAMFSDAGGAESTRTELVRAGFATDRVDVVARSAPGPAALMPLEAGERQFTAYFRSLLSESTLNASASDIAKRVEGDEAAVVIQPRGRVELSDAEAVLAAGAAKQVFKDVRDSLEPTPVVGEHAAGKS